MFCTISKDILFCFNYSPTKGLCFYGDCVQKTGNGKEKVCLIKIVELLMFSFKSLKICCYDFTLRYVDMYIYHITCPKVKLGQKLTSVA